MEKNKIYLDYNATTPILPEIFNAMLPYLKDKWGNPSSAHWAGDSIKEAIEVARENIAKSLNCNSSEIYFTSSGTESDNWAIKLAVLNSKLKKKHIITTSVEHPAVLETCYFLEKFGIDITYLKVDSKGNLNLEELENSINENTILISAMMANNETGVIFPIEKISQIAKKYNVLTHVDAVQAYGKMNINLKELKVDFLSISGHKVYSPKGIGILFIRDGVGLEPLIHGGGQEKGLRSGTENVAGIVALGKSAEIILSDISKGEQEKLKKLRDKFEEIIFSNLEKVYINGDNVNRLCNTSNLCFSNIETTALTKALSIEGIAVSAGSACASHKGSYSHVLKAMGKSKLQALSSLRISIGKGVTEENICYSADILIKWVKRLRAFSPENLL